MKTKYRELLIIVLFILILASNVFSRELSDLDELWNYNFARNVANGLKPYEDFNIILTPLIPLLCGILLKVFGEQLIVMRILCVLLCSMILFIVYKILRELKINKYFSILCTLLLYCIYYQYFCIDYNFFVLLIILLTIFLELKKNAKTNNLFEVNAKYDMLLGILVGTSILIKQTTGIFFSLIFIFYKILTIPKNLKVKDVLKILFIRSIGVIIPVIILILYLRITNTWNSFLDYAIYGIGTFNNSISYLNLIRNENILIRILSKLIPIVAIYMYFKTIVIEQKKEEDTNLFILFCFSIASFIVVFPISDNIHFLIGSMPFIISLIYIIYLKLKEIIIKKEMQMFIKIFVKTFTKMFIFLIIMVSLFIIKNYLLEKQLSSINHYKYIPSNLDNQITIIDDYIKTQHACGKGVYILDATACIYMIPIDIYNKNYDMFNKGNLGAKGEEGQIEKLKNENNTIVLILNDNYRRNWQNPEKVRAYIINDWNKIGEILHFDIYEKNS